MIKKVEYQTIEEREQLVHAHAHLFLAEEQNLISGNFLLFSDIEPVGHTVYTHIPETEMVQLKDRLLMSEQAIDFLIMTGGGF